MAAAQHSVKLNVHATFIESTGPVSAAHAYVFSARGELLADGALDAKGAATLEVRAGENARLTLIVGPTVDKADFFDLRRRGGHEQMLRVAERVIDVAVKIPPDRWQVWPILHLCTVRGTLYKRFPFTFGHHDHVVPNARVEVYEVDPWPRIIIDLPREVIDKLRDYFREPYPLPWPPPDPPEEFDEIEIPMPALTTGARFMAKRAAPTQASAMQSTAVQTAAMQRDVGATMRASTLSDLSAIAVTASDRGFRDALVRFPDLVRPILCYFYRWGVKMSLVATAMTDECGRFETWFARSIFNPDTPDLYFKARQNTILGPMTLIYAPTPIVCNTWWDYTCGNEVKLYTRHRFAISKHPCPDLSDGVVVDRVGDVSLANIYGASTRLAPTLAAESERLGLMEPDSTIAALGFKGRPWGGDLRLRLEFDTDLPTNAVKYYRVKWRRHGDLDPANEKPVNGAVTWTAVKFKADGTPEYSAYKIGPTTVNAQSDLFEVHSRGNPAPGGIGFWSPNGTGGVVANNTNALLDSHAIAPHASLADPPNPDQPDKAGLFDLMIELLDSNANVINPATAGIKFFVPPSLVGDTTGDEASTLGLMVGNRFIFTLHIDNNKPRSDVQEPTLDGVGAGPCGYLKYTGLPPGIVRVPYIAGHRNGWAIYDFNVRKGPGYVIDQPSAAVGAASLTTAKQLATTASSLLGTCSAGGFSAELSVDALATTGWAPVYPYTFFDAYAFAIAP